MLLLPLFMQQICSSCHLLRLLLLCLLQLARQSISLGLDPLLSSLASSLSLGTFGVHLLLENALTLFLGLGLVNLQHTPCQSCNTS